MARGRGGKFKGPRKPRPGPGEEEEDGSEEEANFKPSNRGLGGQSSNVGMLPPSDDDEEEEEDGGEKKEEKPKPAAGSSSAGRAAPARKPADDDDDDDDDDDEDDDDDSEESDDAPVNDYLTAPRQPKKQETVERDAETIRKDLERLELIRKRREDDRLQRIAKEGWDRFAPVSETNKPPGSVPTDHPSQKS